MDLVDNLVSLRRRPHLETRASAKGKVGMSEDINQLIWQTTQISNKNYLHHYTLLHRMPNRESWDPVDEAIYGVNDLFETEVEEANRLRFDAIRYSFNFNYMHNRFYHSVCEQRGVKPENIVTLNDLPKVPLIPQRIFKQYPEPELFIPWLRGIGSGTIKYPRIEGSSYVEIIDKLNQYGIKILFSSGTTGKSSMLPRDPTALIREAHYRVSYWRLEGHQHDSCYFGLGLDPRKLHSNWSIAHGLGGDITAMHSEDKIFHTLDINSSPETVKTLMGIEKGKMQIEKKVKDAAIKRQIQLLENLKEKGLKGRIHGPPYLINEFLSKIEASGKDLHLGDTWTVGTGGGGWVGIQQEDLYKRIEKVLEIPDWNCRDVYGMAEKTFAFPSCKGHYYHIPYTVIQPFVLDDNLEPLGFGKWGRWAFIDPVPIAYPGYIITEDRVKLLETCPVCSRPGPVISPPISRMPGQEESGCSEMMKKLMEQEVTKV